MNWIVVVIAGWIALGMEVGLRDALQLGDKGIAPSFVLIYIAFIAAWARRPHALWTALILGIITDLLTNVPVTTGETITIVGVSGLSYTLAAYTAYILRAWMFRRNALAVAFMSAASALVAAALAVTLLKIRSAYDPIQVGGATAELGQRAASALYTGVAALVVVWVLNLLRPLFKFPQNARGRRI